MFADRALTAAWADRVARDAGIDVVVSAWRELPPTARADGLAAGGDLVRAALCGAPGWAELSKGEVVQALRLAREAYGNDPRPISLLEAEALVAAGAMAAGLRYLARLSNGGHVPATVALARRRHALGDHRGAAAVAGRLPMHAHACLVAARALMALQQPAECMRRIEPFLAGGAPIPDAMTAGAFSAIAASGLARLGQTDKLRGFGKHLLTCPDPPSEATPSLARTAWTAGYGREAWDRLSDESDPWMVAGRVELASLAGDASLMRGLMQRAGPLGVTAQGALALIEGIPPTNGLDADKSYHVWRTHPSRWQPWIDGAVTSAGEVSVWDLAAGNLPDDESIPHGILDDSALVTTVDPVPVPARDPQGEGVWLDRPLCAGIGVGHDFPNEEREALERLVSASSPGDAAVWVTGVDRALAHAAEGRRTVVIAPPGDPFWAGPLPERAWPAFRVVRADPHAGWQGAAERVATVATELAGA